MLKYTEFSESSLSRVRDWMDRYDTGHITAFKGTRTKKENMEINRKLLAYLMDKGYGVSTVKGSYLEHFGKDNEKEVGETTFFVVDRHDTGNVHSDLIKLGIKFDQDSVLLVDKGIKNPRLFGTSKRDDSYPGWQNQVKPGEGKFGKRSGQFFSRVNGRVYTFEEFQTRNGRWAASIIAKEIDETS